MCTRHRSLILTLFLVLLAACSDYDIKVNDRVVYTPAQLFSDFEIADEGLRDCVTQTIADQALTSSSQLLDLICSNAGISDLSGLSIFHALRRIRLSDNKVRNLMELQKMDQLQELYLDNNRIIDPVPLYGLSGLHFLDLSGNPNLQCPKAAGFSWTEELVLPKHCR